MIKKIGFICGLALSLGMALGAGAPASAAKPLAIEKELLGVRILQDYHAVLAHYGAPTRIFRADETISYREALNLAGEPTGGILGIEDGSSGGPGGGGMGAGMAGGGPMGGPMGGGKMGAMGGGSPYGAMGSGAPYAARGGGYPGSGGGSSPYAAMGRGYPGGGGSPYGAGGAGGSGMAGGGQASNGGDNYADAGGFTWVYLYPLKELAYEFHFNKDGRLERIAELGRSFGQHTSRGIGLGDTIEKVYSTYGWTDSLREDDANKFSLLYNDKYHAQFLVLKNRVIGISVFLKENQSMRFEGGTGGGARPGMGGSFPGAMGSGYPGAMGRGAMGSGYPGAMGRMGRGPGGGGGGGAMGTAK